MAQKGTVQKIRLYCSKCNRINYTTTKSGGVSGKLELRKFCKWCKKHTVHKETSVSKK